MFLIVAQDPNEMQEYVERVASEMQPGLSLVLPLWIRLGFSEGCLQLCRPMAKERKLRR